jgi:Protein of unknown function (DUF992)
MLRSGMIVSTALLIASAVPAAAQTRAKVGMLTCKTGPSVGLIVGSRQHMQCRFAPDNGLPSEIYAGTITRLGLDVGISAGGVMAWGVLATTATLPNGSLRGRYVGASGDISLGLGAGANVLVGGSHNTLSLQPLSVEGQAGVNLALGVAGLVLR